MKSLYPWPHYYAVLIDQVLIFFMLSLGGIGIYAGVQVARDDSTFLTAGRPCIGIIQHAQCHVKPSPYALKHLPGVIPVAASRVPSIKNIDIARRAAYHCGNADDASLGYVSIVDWRAGDLDAFCAWATLYKNNQTAAYTSPLDWVNRACMTTARSGWLRTYDRYCTAERVYPAANWTNSLQLQCSTLTLSPVPFGSITKAHPLCDELACTKHLDCGTRLGYLRQQLVAAFPSCLPNTTIAQTALTRSLGNFC